MDMVADILLRKGGRGEVGRQIHKKNSWLTTLSPYPYARARYIFACHVALFDQPGGGDEAERATAHAGAAGRGTESHLDGVSER
jgi:hypothetical protein